MQSSSLRWCAPLLLAAAWCWPQDPPEAPPAARERDWSEILGRTQARWPAPRPAVKWLDSFEPAKQIAAREGRPMFVVMRCLPCKQCSDFDAAVLEGGPLLTPLLQQFVTVRLTNVQPVDLRQFPMHALQDLDLSWWGWFIAPEGPIYGVFGGKDDQGDSTRISTLALATTLKRVLDHHYDPRHADWDVDVKPLKGDKPMTPFDLPGFASWGRRFVQASEIECLHCHQVAEILRQPAIDAKKFDKLKDLQVWPFPENAGFKVARDDGLLVESVVEGSPAAAIGLEAGDRIGGAGAKKLFSQADLRAALQRVPTEGGELELHWMRKGALGQGTLKLGPGWKRVALGWRQSVAGGNFGANPGMAWANPLKPEERDRLGIPLDRMGLHPYFGKEKNVWPAQIAGLGAGDVILSVNDRSPNVAGREFMVWFRLTFEPGDEIKLHVRNNKGAERDVTYRAPGNGR